MTPSDHNQAEYVRGIQVGKRIQSQHQTAIGIGYIFGMFILGVILGTYIGATVYGLGI